MVFKCNCYCCVFVLILGLLCTDLVKAVPDEHKKFLADLVWVHEEVRIVLVAFLSCFSKSP